MTDRWTWHGGGVAAARAHFGDGPHPWLDLSTGINPHPWPIPDTLAIDWHRLPDERDLNALEQAAARHFGADPDHVCALPGTEIGLRLLGEFIDGPACYLSPGYRTHADVIPNAVPIDDLAQARGKALTLANPNNPDGRLYPRHALLPHAQDNWLIVDEAFADATPHQSLAADVGDVHRLVVLRSFGKFFGLAGLRLGFLLGPRPLIDQLRQRLGAWPVSAAAIAIGRRAYADAEWIDRTRTALHQQAARLDPLLQRHGLSPTGSSPLFRLIATPQAPQLFKAFAEAQILTRPFDYNSHWLRLGLPPSEADLARIEDVLRHV